MAIIKNPLFKSNAYTAIMYVVKQAEGKDMTFYSTELTNDPKTASEEFLQLQQFMRKKSNNQAIDYVQSWSEEDSKKYSPQLFHKMGKELAERYFKNHQFIVVTHTTTQYTHNHIIINPVNGQSKKRITNKGRVKDKITKELRSLNDEICKSHGLSILKDVNKDKTKRTPYWVRDLKNKADFAKSIATSFDEYVAYLSEMKVKVKVEDKNISYLYGNKKRKRRGSKLGIEYDKEGLVKRFKENDIRFRNDPQMRSDFISDLKQHLNIRNIQTKESKDPSKLFEIVNLDPKKDYEKFTKVPRRDSEFTIPDEESLRNSFIPIKVFKRAAKGNILDYCRENKISLKKDKEGNYRLKFSSHVMIKDNEWINTKSQTKGSLIEFVSIHKRVSYLEAIAHITDNKRLLILEKGNENKIAAYKSFWLPKEKRLGFKEALKVLSNFLKKNGLNPKDAQSLLVNKNAQISRDNKIRIFADNDEKEGAWEYTYEKEKWTKRKYGMFNSPFISKSTIDRKALVFTDPFSYLLAKKNGDLSKSENIGVVVLMEPNKSVLSEYLYKNPNVNQLYFATENHKEGKQKELLEFQSYKKKLHDFGFSINAFEDDRSLEKEGRDLEIEF